MAYQRARAKQNQSSFRGCARLVGYASREPWIQPLKIWGLRFSGFVSTCQQKLTAARLQTERQYYQLLTKPQGRMGVKLLLLLKLLLEGQEDEHSNDTDED